jgi:acyl carrier protein
MVFGYLKNLLSEQFACDEDDIELASLLDDLNLTDSDRAEIAFILSEHYGVEISDSQAEEFSTVEDIVACVEDQL